MQRLKIGNKVISTDLYDIVKDIQSKIRNNKLKVIKRQGTSNIRVTCPFHKNGLESRPSADIFIGDSDEVEYGTFKCFTCSEHAPFYHFVAECFEESDEWAKQWLVDNYADGVVEYELDLPEIKLETKEIDVLDESLLNTFQDFHPYMLKRKLTKEVCNQFEVKYDPKTECLVFPVRDEKSNLVMCTRRSVNTKKFIIDANKEKPVYLLYYLEKRNIQEAYITESQVNALTLWTHNLPGVALFGTGSKHQYDILNKSGIRVYHLMFDGDEAGDKGIEKFLKNIRKDVIVDIIRMPRGKDVNDLDYNELEDLIMNSNNSLYIK